MTLDRIPTGTDVLDEKIEGGFPRGSLITVAGTPGSGKTVFSANFLLKGVDSGESVVYASFGENMETFSANLSKHFQRDIREYIREGRITFLDLSSMREGGAPAMIQTILDKVEKLEASRLVLDSFSSLSLTFEKKLDTRTMLQAIVGRIVRHLGCTTLIVTEIPLEDRRVGTGVEEFVADGVIELSYGKVENRLLRLLEIRKLRGTRLIQREFVFTLDGGFRLFAPLGDKPVMKEQEFKVIQDKPGKFSSGCEDLDLLLGGGYPVGSTILLEIDHEVDLSTLRVFAAQTARNFMLNGRASVSLLATAALDKNSVAEAAARSGVCMEDLARYTRMCVRRSDGQDDNPVIVPLTGEGIETDRQTIMRVEDELVRETGKPLVCIFAYDPEIAQYGEEAVMRIAVSDAARTRERGNLSLVMLESGYGKVTKLISTLSDIHMRIIERNGVVLLHGVRPRTALHAFEIDTSGGHLRHKLTPIV